MKDKYILIIKDEDNEISLEIQDYLTGTRIEFTSKELGFVDGLTIGSMCKKLIELTKDKYRSIADDTFLAIEKK